MRFFQSTKNWLVILTACTYSLFGNTNGEFEFVSNKDNGLSKKFMTRLIDIFHPDVFFETGTYDGQTAINAASLFNKVITVEIYRPLFDQMAPRLSPYSNIHRYFGNSSEVIANVSGNLDGTILFWLDAHYSGEGTGMTESANSGSPEAITAIREELKAIKTTGIRDCVILIDDIRGFGTNVQGHTFLGCWAYPTVQEVKAALLEINPEFELALLGDMLLAYDASKHDLKFSPAVEVCTKTRLYDGYNLSEQELKELGEKMQKAKPAEKKFIKELYDMMAIYNDPMFWHDIWQGLILKGRGNNSKAQELFQRSFARIQSVTSESDAESVFQSVSATWQAP